jgi:hypothetical protein
MTLVDGVSPLPIFKVAGVQRTVRFQVGSPLFHQHTRRRQVAKKWRRYGSSIESNSVERNSFRKEQLRLGADHFERRNQTQTARRLVERLESLGLIVEVRPAA